MLDSLNSVDEITNDLMTSMDELAHVIGCINIPEVTNNLAYVLPLGMAADRMAADRMAESMKELTYYCKCYTNMAIEVAKDAGIDIPDYNPDQPKEWKVLWNPGKEEL